MPASAGMEAQRGRDFVVGAEGWKVGHSLSGEGGVGNNP